MKPETNNYEIGIKGIFEIKDKTYKVIGINSDPHIIYFRRIKDGVTIEKIYKMLYSELIKKIKPC